MIYHPVLVCKCDTCPAVEEFTNEHGHSDRILEDKALAKGWYIVHTGKDMCPKCAQAVAAKLGIPSLFAYAVPVGVRGPNIIERNIRGDASANPPPADQPKTNQAAGPKTKGRPKQPDSGGLL